MLVDFPLFYTIVGRKPGRRNALSYRVHEYTSLEVREVDGTDAPIAAVWSQPSHGLPWKVAGQRTNQGKSDPDGRQMTRWFEGKHWKRALVADTSHIDPLKKMRLPVLDMTTFQRLLPTGRVHRALGILHRIVPSKQVSGGGVVDFDEIRSTTLETEKCRAENALANCISVDGELYVKCLEPYIRVLPYDRQEMNVFELAFETSSSVISPASIDVGTMVFSLKDFEKATRYASKNPALRAAYEDWFTRWRPTIVLEEAFTTDWGLHMELGKWLYRFVNNLSDPAGVVDDKSVLRIVTSGDPEARLELVESLSRQIPEFERARVYLPSLLAACELVEDREISVPMSNSPLPR